MVPQDPGPPHDCTLCGACCFAEEGTYLPLFQVDLDRLLPQDQRMIENTGGRWYMRIAHGRCAALRADPGSQRLLCSIYLRRPDVCRSLVRGSAECREHHRTKRELARQWCESLRIGPQIV